MAGRSSYIAATMAALLCPQMSHADVEPHIGEYEPGTDVTRLQSFKGADRVLFINLEDLMIDGELEVRTPEEVWQIWQTAASAYSAFAVNVTTDSEVYAAIPVEQSGQAQLLNRDCGRANNPFDSFGTTRYTCVDASSRSAFDVGRTLAHELGHMFALNHDGGQPGGEYFNGLPEFKWVPLMGNYYMGDAWFEDALFQWSQGEYEGASDPTDDLDKIGSYLGFRSDDIPDKVPLIIGPTGDVDPLHNRGQINAGLDADHFAFEINEAHGRLRLTINRSEYLGGAMLDITASIQTMDGQVLIEHNAPAARHSILETELEPGLYMLVVRGGAEGTPQHGFSNYGSIGFYTIEGFVEGVGGDETEGDGGEAETSSGGDEEQTEGEVTEGEVTEGATSGAQDQESEGQADGSPDQHGDNGADVTGEPDEDPALDADTSSDQAGMPLDRGCQLGQATPTISAWSWMRHVFLHH